jgi:hypothetical protein
MSPVRIVCALLVFALSACNAAAPPAALPQFGSSARVAAGASITIDPSQRGAVVSPLVLGANMGTWYDLTQPNMAPAFRTAGMTATRWPGGSESDQYHWQTNSFGKHPCNENAYINPNTTFDSFLKDIVAPAKLDVAITVNYGSNPACTAGADPSEAAGWVKYVNNDRKLGVKWWTVGNEEFGSWETDLHTLPHDPAQYAQNVADDFYPQMKKASSSPINVCVDVDPDTRGWDATVLAKAKYDCVELHFYPEGTKSNDEALIAQDPAKFDQYLQSLKKELKAAGHASTPIYVGELGSTYGTPGKQTMSITQALFSGQLIGQMLQNGVARATWWLGYGNCLSKTAGGDFNSLVYGWQDFGGYMIFSDGTVYDGCSKTNVPRGTVLPTGSAFEVASNFVRDGEHMLGVSVKSAPNVRAFASTYDGGYALLLFNLDKDASIKVPVRISGMNGGSGGTTVVYDKSLYDYSKNNIWKTPADASLPAWKGSFTVTLPAWSMMAVRTK